MHHRLYSPSTGGPYEPKRKIFSFNFGRTQRILSMKKNGVLLFMLIGVMQIGISQPLPFANDRLYKTIYAVELCDFQKQHPDFVLLDVRSPGEFSDTSRFASLNHGHLKGAVNLNIEDIRKDSTLLDPYKNKTVVVYCSHSQRSRRISKFMADNGFSSFYNLNGGMSSLNQLTEAEFPCKKEWIVTTLPYKNLSFIETEALIRNKKELTIIDVRTAAQFNSKDTSITENVGRIKGAINIPFDEFKNRLPELEKYRQKPLLIYGQSGDGSAAKASMLLMENGFTTVYHLLGGITGFISTLSNTSIIENPSPFVILNAERALNLLQSGKELSIYDARPVEEYNNQVTGTLAYRNLGRLKNAVHTQDVRLVTADKNKTILIYGHKEAFRLAGELARLGYKNIFLMNSFYDFVWSGFNVESCKGAKAFLVNSEGLY